MATNKKHKRNPGHGLVSDRIPEAIEGLKTTRIPKVATGIPALVALGSVAEVSNTPASKSVVITIEAARGGAEESAIP